MACIQSDNIQNYLLFFLHPLFTFHICATLLNTGKTERGPLNIIVWIQPYNHYWDRALTLVHYLCNCRHSQIHIHPGVVSTLGRHGLWSSFISNQPFPVSALIWTNLAHCTLCWTAHGALGPLWNQRANEVGMNHEISCCMITACNILHLH